MLCWSQCLQKIRHLQSLHIFCWRSKVIFRVYLLRICSFWECSLLQKIIFTIFCWEYAHLKNASHWKIKVIFRVYLLRVCSLEKCSSLQKSHFQSLFAESILTLEMLSAAKDHLHYILLKVCLLEKCFSLKLQWEAFLKWVYLYSEDNFLQQKAFLKWAYLQQLKMTLIFQWEAFLKSMLSAKYSEDDFFAVRSIS